MNRLKSGAIPADPILTGRAVARQNPTTSNPLAVFQAKYQGGSNGVQVDIVAGVAINALSIRLLRGMSRDPSQAKIVQTWNGPFVSQDNLQYTDIAPAVLAATKVYYWASIIYEQTPTVISQQFGPQTAFINATAGVSEQIPAFGFSIKPDSGVLDVAVSFQLPNSSDFGYAQVFAIGYNAIAAPQLIAQNATSPFLFTMQPTGETVTLQVNAVTNSGRLIQPGPTLQVHLVATATVPAAIYNGTAISNTVGNQITFPGPAESNATAMKVYRQNAGGTFSGATLISTLAPSPEKSYTVTDQIANPQHFIYFVTAVNSVGESAPSPAIVPGTFNSNASQGSGATALPYIVTTTSAGGVTPPAQITFISAAPITNQGENYYAQPLVTFSTPSAGGRPATGNAVLDGAGHVIFIQITDGGVYTSADVGKATVSIHY